MARAPRQLPFNSSAGRPAMPPFLCWMPLPVRPRRRTRPLAAGRALLGLEPRVPRGVPASVVGVEVDEAPLNQPVTDLEDVAPAAGAPLGDSCAPRTILVLAVARALGDHQVTAGEDPVEVRVVVRDRLDRPAHVAEELADLRLAGRESPFREVDLCVDGEEIEDAAASRGDTAVVERLQVFQGDRLALLIGHEVV